MPGRADLGLDSSSRLLYSGGTQGNILSEGGSEGVPSSSSAGGLWKLCLSSPVADLEKGSRRKSSLADLEGLLSTHAAACSSANLTCACVSLA